MKASATPRLLVVTVTASDHCEMVLELKEVCDIFINLAILVTFIMTCYHDTGTSLKENRDS